jgi:hypothetical protein
VKRPYSPYWKRTIALCVIAIVTAFAFAIAARELASSRTAGAVTFIVILIAFLPAVYWPVGRATPRPGLIALTLLSVASLGVAALTFVLLSWPYGAILGTCVLLPAVYLWIAGFARGKPNA